MTEPTTDVGAASEAETAPRRGRGRPRPESVLAQDRQVYEALTGPKNRAQLVTDTGLRPQQVYLSLWRLRKTNVVVRGAEGTGRHTWSRAANAPTDYPTAFAESSAA